MIMTAKETLELISKQWCTIEDLKKLSNLGNNNVYRLKKEMQEELEANGYILPKGLIPMCEVVKKLKIDIDYLNRLANLS